MIPDFRISVMKWTFILMIFLHSTMGLLALLFPKYFQEIILLEANTEHGSLGTTVSGACLMAGTFASYLGTKRPLQFAPILFFEILSTLLIVFSFVFGRFYAGISNNLLLEILLLSFLLLFFSFILPWTLIFSQRTEDLCSEFLQLLEESRIPVFILYIETVSIFKIIS